MEEKGVKGDRVSTDQPVIRLDHVSKIYPLPFGDVTALDDVSLDVEPGAFIAVMGPSGSGKSTLLNVIGCLDVPTKGDLFIAGRNIGELSDDELTDLRRDTLGFIFQQFNLIPLLTVRENVEYPLVLKTRRRESEGLVEELTRRVGLEEELLSHKPSELSGGQQQRVAIARALVNDPEILLCDEPTGNLDTKTGTLIMELLTEVNGQGKTIIMVTHDPRIAEYAHRTINLVDGKIV
ncbi:MAG TPA: ABC transporter ATP-binding protein [Methanoculleus sp.]|nr:ABC transporter ATP-binding protein [Methanoculleus sp.]